MIPLPGFVQSNVFGNMKNRILFFTSKLLLLCSLCVIFAMETSPVTHIVVIKDLKFQPEELRVSHGDSAKFLNHDLVDHNVTEENDLWASPVIAAKTSWTYFITQGVDYYCSFHPMMRGKLKMTEK